MRHLRPLSPLTSAALSALALSTSGLLACDEAEAEPSGVTLEFRALVNDLPFACGTVYGGLGTSDTSGEFSDFRFYVSDIHLLTADGQEVPAPLVEDGLWQREHLALLDFEDQTGRCSNGTAPTNTTVRTLAPRGDYTGVRFTVGVPFADNHGDAATAPTPLNLTALFWNWNAGYKFMRIDARLDDARGFNFHLGSIGCSMDLATATVGGCERPNRPVITLEGFNPTEDVIVIDAAALYANLDLSEDLGGAPGCMSAPDDPECRALFESVGLSVDDAELHPGQTVFSSRPR